VNFRFNIWIIANEKEQQGQQNGFKQPTAIETPTSAPAATARASAASDLRESVTAITALHPCVTD
jgi:hypothetical protein